MPGKPEDFIGANPGSVEIFQQKGLMDTQHLVNISLIDKHTHYNSQNLCLGKRLLCTTIPYKVETNLNHERLKPFQTHQTTTNMQKVLTSLAK